jgi:hypothetical protein
MTSDGQAVERLRDYLRTLKPFPWVSGTAFIARYTKGLAEKPDPFHVASCCDLFSFVFNGSRLVRVSRRNIAATCEARSNF